MRTIVTYRKIGNNHDALPAQLVLPGRRPLTQVADAVHRQFRDILNTGSHTVRVTATGPYAGEVVVYYGPLAATGLVRYEGQNDAEDTA
jgi:hypothetical protein